MSETIPNTDDGVKGAEYRRHTVAWKPDEWRRIEEAAKRLADSTHAEISEVDLIRGSVLRRADEILSEAA